MQSLSYRMFFLFATEVIEFCWVSGYFPVYILKLSVKFKKCAIIKKSKSCRLFCRTQETELFSGFSHNDLKPGMVLNCSRSAKELSDCSVDKLSTQPKNVQQKCGKPDAIYVQCSLPIKKTPISSGKPRQSEYSMIIRRRCFWVEIPFDSLSVCQATSARELKLGQRSANLRGRFWCFLFDTSK